MLRTLPGALFAAMFLFFGPGAPATAATLGLTVNPGVGFSQTGAIEITDDGTDLLIANAFAAPLVSVGLPGLSDNAFDLFAFGDSLDLDAAMVTLFIDGLDGSVEGELVAFDVTATLAELLFTIVRDDFGLFGAQALMVLAGDFSQGFNATDASVTINPVAAIPLPATLPLLLTALLGAAAVRRRRA